MRSRTRRRTLLFAAAVILGTSPAPELALCVGSDGHRALELASADCCPNEITESHRDGFEPAGRGCASDCTDTLLSMSAAIKRSSPATDLDADFHSRANLITLSSTYLSTTPASWTARDRDGPSSTHLADLRSRLSVIRRL